MYSSYKFINVMSPPTNGGLISFQLDTFDSSGDLSTNFSVELPENSTPIKCARIIQAKFKSILGGLGASYGGYPTFSGDTPTSAIQVTSGDHTVCLWSEATLSLTVDTSELADGFITVTDNPTLMDLEYTKKYGPTWGETFTNDAGEALTDEEIIIILETLSDQACILLNNYIVPCTYKHTEIFYRTVPSMYLGRRPVQSWNAPSIRKSVWDPANYTSLPNYFNVNPDTGEVTYKAAQNMLDVLSPFEEGNESVMTYVAGSTIIPALVKSKLLQYSSLADLDPVVTRMKHGTFQVDLATVLDAQESFKRDLVKFEMGVIP